MYQLLLFAKIAFKVGCTLLTFFCICKVYNGVDCSAQPGTMMGGLSRARGSRAVGDVKADGEKKECMQSLWVPDAKWQRGKRNCIDKRWLAGSGAGPLASLSMGKAASASGLTEAECWYGLSPATAPTGPGPRLNPKSSHWRETELK